MNEFTVECIQCSWDNVIVAHNTMDATTKVKQCPECGSPELDIGPKLE